MSFQAQGKRFPSDFPEAARLEILTTESALGFDVVTGLVGAKYSEDLLELLLQRLQTTQYTEAQEQYLVLLTSLIEQSRVPDEALRGEVIPALDFFLREQAGSGTQEAERLARLARRAQWQATVKNIPQADRRLAFLGQHVRADLYDGSYYTSAALDAIAEIGTSEAIELLHSKLTDAESRGFPQTLVEELRLSLEKAEIARRLKRLGAGERARELAGVVAERRQLFLEAPAAGDLLIWLVRELERTNGSEAATALSAVWKDPDLGERYRYEAQEALIRLGKVEPVARTIAYDF